MGISGAKKPSMLPRFPTRQAICRGKTWHCGGSLRPLEFPWKPQCNIIATSRKSKKKSTKIAQHQNLRSSKVQVYFDYIEMVPEQYDWLAKDLAAVNRQLTLKYTGGGNAGWKFSQTGNSTPLLEMLWYQRQSLLYLLECSTITFFFKRLAHFPTKIREQKKSGVLRLQWALFCKVEIV